MRPVPTSPRRRQRSFWPARPTRRAWHYAAAVPWLLMAGFFAFVRGTDVPVLGVIDLAIHEFGHVWTLWMPRVLNLAMGVGTQVLVPLVLAAGLWFRSDDPLGAGLCLTWAGTSAQDGSVYIADAPFQRLPLIGGVHDWATLLGPRHLDALWAAEDLGRLVWTVGLVLFLAGCGLLAAGALAASGRAMPSWVPAAAAPPAGPAIPSGPVGWSTTAGPSAPAPQRLSVDPNDPADPAWRPPPRPS